MHCLNRSNCMNPLIYVTNSAAWWLLYSVVFYIIIRKQFFVICCIFRFICSHHRLPNDFRETIHLRRTSFPYACIRHQYRPGSTVFRVRSGNKNVLKNLKLFVACRIQRIRISEAVLSHWTFIKIKKNYKAIKTTSWKNE